MPRFINTTGRSNLAIGICDRCKLKFPLEELQADRNSPGLRVCKKDLDQRDPWREPAPPSENVSLQYPRPDEPIS